MKELFQLKRFFQKKLLQVRKQRFLQGGKFRSKNKNKEIMVNNIRTIRYIDHGSQKTIFEVEISLGNRKLRMAEKRFHDIFDQLLWFNSPKRELKIFEALKKLNLKYKLGLNLPGPIRLKGIKIKKDLKTKH